MLFVCVRVGREAAEAARIVNAVGAHKQQQSVACRRRHRRADKKTNLGDAGAVGLAPVWRRRLPAGWGVDAAALGAKVDAAALGAREPGRAVGPEVGAEVGVVDNLCLLCVVL